MSLLTLRIVPLPQLQKVLIDQAHDMEAVGHDHGIGEVLLGEPRIRLGQIHHNDAHILTPGEDAFGASRASSPPSTLQHHR